MSDASPLSQYEVLQAVGKGSFGIVSKVRRRSDGKILVWKELNYGTMSEKEKQLVVSEVSCHRVVPLCTQAGRTHRV
jgi:NIMA (never in mitosis gene a)-related kinase